MGRNILLLVGSLLLVVALSEFTVRMFVPVRMVGSSFTIYDPVYGKRLKKNFTTIRKTPEFTIRFSTNSNGFRGPEPEVFPSRAVMFLGDSCTMGYGVNDGEEFPALVRGVLAKRKPAIPVVNTGMGANGNGRWIKFLRSEGKKYDPRVVVLQLMANDFSDNLGERLFGLSKNGDLIELPVPPIETVRVVQNFVDRIPGLANSYLLGLAYQALWSFGKHGTMAFADAGGDGNTSRYVDALTYRILEEVISICNREGWPILAILVGIQGERSVEIERRLHDANIPTIRTPTRKERPDLYYEIDGHWNRAGHALAAKLILAELARLHIL